MGRVAKKAPAAAAKETEEESAMDSPTQTITQTRTRRTPKPNPKYTNESIVATPKIESDTPGSSDTEEKPAQPKVGRPKKVAETPASAKAAKTPAAKGKGAASKKQKLEYDEEEKEPGQDEEEGKPVARKTRSKGGAADTLKVGEESVAIIDVSSIISKAPAPAPTPVETPKNARGRKRAVQEESPKEEVAKKKKDDEKPSLITARKSYMPSPAVVKKTEAKVKPKDELKEEESTEEVKTPRGRRNATAPVESPKIEGIKLVEKKEDEKPADEVKPEVKKLSIVRRAEQITKVSPASVVQKTLPVVAPRAIVKTSPTVKATAVMVQKSSPVFVQKALPGIQKTSPMTIVQKALPTKVVSNNVITTAVMASKPTPRILNSMVTPKGKQSPNVKLSEDGTDKKVFSIDLTDDSIKEKKTVTTVQVKSPPVAVKENVAINRPPPGTNLTRKLESELERMKQSANFVRRAASTVAGRQSTTIQSTTSINTLGNVSTRRITKFESWYVIDVKNQEPTPFRHSHTFSLIHLGNNIKNLMLPSAKWDYKVTLQRRVENNNEEEVYTGDVNDKTTEAEKASYEPSSILFKRSLRDGNRVTIDRSLMLKPTMYTITMNGKQCKLVCAPDNINALEDLEELLSIIDTSNLEHSCVELVSNTDIITLNS